MEIECKFSIHSGYYKCSVTKAAINKPNIDIASIKGKHRPKKSNNDVNGIDFENVLVEHFPRNLQKFFPNLNTLRIENCCLKQISREDLIGLEKLVCLSLDSNQLTSLPDDLFSNMPNLNRVWLSHNKVEFASSKLIEPIVGNQLECFGLRGNASIDEFYYPACRTGCKTIQELMAKIDEKCKPPTTQMIAKTPKRGSNCYDTADEVFKGLNEFRLLSRFTDFVIVVGSKEFPVHKNILALQSPILADMFVVKTNGRIASKLEISDLSAEAVEAFLAYLYERKLPGARNAMEIFKLAAKYKIAKLKTICEGIIQENLVESNAFEIFKLACGPHKSEKLKVAAFRKLKEKLGGELGDDLMNKPEKLQKIVEAFLVIAEAKKVFDDLINESSTKKQRLA